ncbi:chromosome segregation protein SMC [Cuniculiplasma sp. SKW4]|uniref:chromosome segregation protein SMC n=1 Tax=Cuniculiplasma sp. SKW4 TaxID=3400171 RepID=UPI003FD07234
MRLYSLEMKNFKSFCPEGIKLDFRPGMTMIGGPNGSGKSNIGDSLLFVLGTRSSKTVRADKMDDLIHIPREGQKRKNEASVTAVFVDDKDSENFEKLEISRVIEDINGEIKSTYYLNGRKARHSDIDKVMDDMGLQLDSYSFVLQGDINDFIKRSGTERRKLLETIAGIESYNMKIEAAKEQVSEIEKNVTASETLQAEIKKNVEVIEEEAKKLKEYKRINEEILNLKATSLSIQIRSYEIDLSSYEQALQKNLEAKEQMDLQINTLKEREKELLKKREEIESGISKELQQQLTSLRERINNIKLEKAKKDVRFQNESNSILEKRERIDQSEEKITEIEKEMEKIAQDFIRLKEDEAKYNSNYEAMKTQISQRIEVQRQRSVEYQEASKKLKGIEEEINKVNSRLTNLRKDEKELDQKYSSIEGIIGSKEEAITSEKYKVSEVRWNLSQIKKNDGEKKGNFDKLNKEYFDLKSEITQLEGNLSRISSRIEQLVRDTEKMRAMMGSQGVANRSISILMDAKAKGLISGIHKPVSDIISYSDELQLAVESAAGGRLNSLVVDDENVAQQCIEYLRSKQAGRVTFLPVNKMVGGRARGKAIMILNEGNTMGLLSQNISYDKQYENIVWYTFQDTILVKDIETAKRYMTGVRIVTLAGDIFEASGAISGGFQEKKQRRGNPQELMKMDDELESSRTEKAQLESALRLKKARFEEVQRDLMEESKKGSEGKGRVETLEKQLEEYTSNLSRMEEELIKLKNERSSLKEKIDNFRRNMEEEASLVEQLNMKKKEMYDLIGNDQEGGNDLNEMQREADLLNSNLVSTRRKITESETNQKRLSERKMELSKEISDLSIEIHESEEEKRRLEREIRELEEEARKYNAMEKELNERNSKILGDLKGIEIEINQINLKVEKINSEKNAIENSILTANIKIGEFKDRISELKSELESNGGIVLSEYSSVQRVKSEILFRERKLEEIGAVNQLAEADLERETKRLSELTEKIEKLRAEIESLIELMANLEEVKKVSLMNLYNQVREEMRKIFARLTNGGDVILYLSDEKDPLNSELLVKARPKGTTYTKLNALSGGEKSLVALSFITAVQRIKPSPIYFLDEIDMFLDGANAERMGELLRENSNTSQIIMISLKNAMTKYAGSLFGVTLNRQTGCTEVFSKSFEEGYPS